MPVISPRRFSTTSAGTNYLPPSSSAGSYRNSLISSSERTNYSSDTGTTSSYYNRSSYRSTLGRNNYGNDSTTNTTSTTSRFGVSQYSRPSLDKDLPPSGSKFISRSESRARDNKSLDSGYTSKNDLNTLSSSSSSLARSQAQLDVDFYEKYSPAHYIPKCELSRSRSLSEAQKLTKDKPIKESYTNSSSSSTTPSSLGKIRNATLRTALPPTSSTANKYWERDRSAITSRTLSDSDAFTLPKSSFTSSSSIIDSYDKGSSSETAEGLCGLRNIGNTCFMNSVLQCLSHTSELTKFLKNQLSPKTTSKDQRIFSEFVKLIKEMWTPNTRSVTPFDLKSAVSSKYRMYSGSCQQDAQEFLRFFLDTLHCSLNSGTKGEKLEIDDNMSDAKKADLTWDFYSKVENSLIKDLFVGQLKSCLKCTVCGNTSVTFDPFWDLSVPLPSSTRCKLENCLEFFIKEEVLDGDEMPTCSKCDTRRKSTKSFSIQRFPKYLVIHLKRFSETRWSKLTNIVEFPTGERELNMAPYASSTNSSPATYTLYGISNHMGSTAGGHYVAICKHPTTRKWHEFNDNIVSDSTDSSLISSSAYLLFYERS